ncbi:MAG TPA: peptide deformylase [Candidatus Paceibacterota bacterium]|nr:peptide deformylase [Candidatus Paceibacterota bacterium]
MRTIIPQASNPALREMAQPIPLADITGKKIQTLITDMRQLLAAEPNGVAIAASQVGEPLQLFVVSGRALSERKKNASEVQASESADARPTEPDQIYINPVFMKLSRGKKEKHEGCLSIRGYWGMVPRAEKATIRAYDEQGKVFTRGASGFLAHIFQHEMDHLNAILYTDKATKLYEEKDTADE